MKTNEEIIKEAHKNYNYKWGKTDYNDEWFQIAANSIELFKENVLKVIDEMPFIVCLKDAEGSDKEWREKIIIQREELFRKIKIKD